MCVSALSEVASLGAFMPLLEVLGANNNLMQHTLFYHFFPLEAHLSKLTVVIASFIIFGITVLLAALIRLSNLWLNLHFVSAIGSDLSSLAFTKLLGQSYEDYILRNSSKDLTALTKHISVTVYSLNAILQMITSAIVAAALLIWLFVINSLAALIAISFFALIYAIIAFNSRRELKYNGSLLAIASTLQVRILQESFNAFREILINQSQGYYANLYLNAEQRRNSLQASTLFLAQYPRYVVEATSLISLAIIGGVLFIQGPSSSTLIPTLGTIALGAQRLLPSLQHIYGGWATIRSSNADITSVVNILNKDMRPLSPKPKTLSFTESIQFDNVSYAYKSRSELILYNTCWKINKGDSIGLIGKTGSGKSTVIDLVAGLLRPTDGKILIDGVPLHDDSRPQRLESWISSIAYVPQSICLLDKTIAENIAFGELEEDIDPVRLESAAKRAQISEFIQSLPNQYKTVVGERGVQLSGGQCQRIAIARALYREADLIILDEATSALDSETELALMSFVQHLPTHVTIIMIAHRLSTLKSCDKVFRLDNGRLMLLAPNDLT